MSSRDDDLRACLQARKAFRQGPLSGGPVKPHVQTAEYQRWARGSVARVFAGALNEHGTAGVIAGGSPLPDLGELDLAPAMGLALGEADYVVRSYRTPIAWHLGPEVYGAGDGLWVEVAESCNAEYGRFSVSTTRHQNRVHAALEAS